MLYTFTKLILLQEEEKWQKKEKKKETLNNSNLFEKKRDIKYPYYMEQENLMS